MQFVAAGTLRRGSALSPDERPEESICLSGFFIDRDPVTNAQFAEFIADGGYRRPTLWTPHGWHLVQELGLQEPNYWRDPVWNPGGVPVTGVNWWEALAFARWAGKTLPTEAQWEYACKDPDACVYPWGDDPPDLSLANYAPEVEPAVRAPRHRAVTNATYRRSDAVTWRATSKWCLDTYAVGYKTAGPDPLHYTDERDDHVVRGGCGLHDEDYLRCSARDHYPPGVRDNLVGFRCASVARPAASDL